MANRRIGDRPMTASERKARSRALALGGTLGHLQVAEDLIKVLRYEVDRPDLVDRLDDLELHVQLAKDLLPGA